MNDNGLALTSANLPFAEELHRAWRGDPAAVGADWRALFESLARRSDSAEAGPSLARPEAELAFRQSRVDQLVRAYRVRGHSAAELDPLGLPREPAAELDPAYYGFAPADLERLFAAPELDPGGAGVLSLGEILSRLRAAYCRSIGAQFMHIDDGAVRRWLQERLEGSVQRRVLGRAEQLAILTRLSDAVIFEEFLQKKFAGAKRFSLEGGESLIPLLQLAIERAAEQGVLEIVLGMAHRGRVNVLHNILGKSAAQIFREFEEGSPELAGGRGDVKYHLGHGSEWAAAGGRRVHLSLCFNPSHLEFVNPVALGRLRAKQERHGDRDGTRSLAILIHGDAAFAGQGVVQETLNLSSLPAYHTGGSIHVVVNNQIGFTTSPEQARSSVYATDVAKLLQVPIFHVNGEDPEAVAEVVGLALDFRHAFRRDAVIDMYCYRRYGHNEGDEPAFTQPRLYAAIRARAPVREGYVEHLLRLGGITRAEADQIAVRRRAELEHALAEARSRGVAPEPVPLGEVWHGYTGGREDLAAEPDTGVPREVLAELLLGLARVPADFRPHPKIERLLAARARMARGELPLDWAAAEQLAFATLAAEGRPVRLSGQDSERGTFSHRHAVLHDVESDALYVPLRQVAPGQAPVEIVNSPLSEVAVLGFEYGYSLDHPDGLVAWEAQFGDFVNVAQPIVDQFLVSAEEKWRRLSGLVLLLPHGFEGQGPEHSSARLERFLTQAAEENIQVALPTTPAQYFHLLRRQVLRRWRKPLVVLTPKSLLRHARVVSSLDDFAGGRFQRVLPDERGLHAPAAARVLLTGGKLYYELADAQDKLGRADTAILRLEELYPLPESLLARALAPYPETLPVVWVQEEPANMGAWRYLVARFGPTLLGHPFSAVARPESASPATGSARRHKLEQDELVARAFA